MTLVWDTQECVEEASFYRLFCFRKGLLTACRRVVCLSPIVLLGIVLPGGGGGVR